jgi:hypothetical protein
MSKNRSAKLSLPLDTYDVPGSKRKLEKKRTTKAERQELFLPVSGFVWFYPEEKGN